MDLKNLNNLDPRLKAKLKLPVPKSNKKQFTNSEINEIVKENKILKKKIDTVQSEPPKTEEISFSEKKFKDEIDVLKNDIKDLKNQVKNLVDILESFLKINNL